jgi:pimeloyl-ACP methyl ester carboxylesterase
VIVALLHAFPLEPSMWEPQRPVLGHVDARMPRLYGRGSSVDGWAEQLLDELEDDLVVVGASMGGYAALAMARRAPKRVRGLLLAGSRRGPDSPERVALRNETIAFLRREGADAWRAAAPFEVPAGVTTDELIAATEALRDRPDATDVVAGFAGPLLLVVGDGDELLSVDEARAIAASASRGRCEVVEGAGHIVNLDQPERFNSLLADFLRPWT